MPLVTLIGEKLAKPGKLFTYVGPNNDCKNCKLKTVCFNLKPGKHYEIITVRDKQHNCAVHEGKVTVVEVKELPIFVSVDKKLNVGSSVKIKKGKCRYIDCENFDICMTTAVQQNKAYTVKKVYEKLSCPLNYELYKVEVTE